MIRTSFGTLTASNLFAVQKIERQSKLPVVEVNGSKFNMPTADFLAAIREYFAAVWRRSIDATQAYQVWLLTRATFAKYRDQFATIGDVCHWMHVDATKLSEPAIIGLAANLPRVKAQHQLLIGSFDQSDYEGVYQLVLMATEDEQQALDARSAVMKSLIDRKSKERPC